MACQFQPHTAQNGSFGRDYPRIFLTKDGHPLPKLRQLTYFAIICYVPALVPVALTYYLDQDWPEQDRIALHAAWLKNSGLSILHATPLLPVHTAVMVAEPERCKGHTEIDWRLVWDKSRFEKTHAHAISATTGLAATARHD